MPEKCWNFAATCRKNVEISQQGVSFQICRLLQHIGPDHAVKFLEISKQDVPVSDMPDIRILEYVASRLCRKNAGISVAEYAGFRYAGYLNSEVHEVWTVPENDEISIARCAGAKHAVIFLAGIGIISFGARK